MRTLPKKRSEDVKRQAPELTFTLRDLNRQPAAVLRACDRRGSVKIRARDGRVYSLRVEGVETSKESTAESFSERMKRHDERMKAAGHVPLSAEFSDRLNDLIREER